MNPHLDTSDFTHLNLPNSAISWLKARLQPGDRILELGSGKSTRELAKFFRVTCVEHDPAFVDPALPDVEYVVVSLENGRYPQGALQAVLSRPFDAIIVDGPPAYLWSNRFVRLGFLEAARAVPGDPLLIVDDAQRIGEFLLVLALGWRGRTLTALEAQGKACVALTPGTSVLLSLAFWRLFHRVVPALLREVRNLVARRS